MWLKKRFSDKERKDLETKKKIRPQGDITFASSNRLLHKSKCFCHPWETRKKCSYIWAKGVFLSAVTSEEICYQYTSVESKRSQDTGFFIVKRSRMWMVYSYKLHRPCSHGKTLILTTVPWHQKTPGLTSLIDLSQMLKLLRSASSGSPRLFHSPTKSLYDHFSSRVTMQDKSLLLFMFFIPKFISLLPWHWLQCEQY